MKPIILKYFLMLVFLAFWQEGIGQDVLIAPPSILNQSPEDNEIVFEHIEEDIAFIHFVSRSSGDTCSTFDVLANSPYHHFNYPLSEDNIHSYGSKMYDTRNIDKREFLNRFRRSEIARTANFERLDFHSLNVYYIIETNLQQNANYVGITYYTMYFDPMGGPIGQAIHTTLVALNNKGETVFQYKDFNNQASTPVVTPDGKYVVFSYGGILGHSDWQPPEGIIMYDLQNGQKILHKDIISSNGNPWIVNGVILTSADLPNKQKRYYVLKPNLGLTYTKVYLRSARTKRESIEIDGFLFKDGHKDYYDKDFESEPFTVINP